jgi:hypothetical protein
MKTIAMVLAMAGAALAQARTVKTQEPPYEKQTLNTKAKAKSGTVVDVKAGTELGYDDNILDLNDKNVEQLENGTRPEKFRIDDPGDFVTSVWVDLKVTGKVLLADPVTAGLEIQPYFYSSNSIANFEEYTLFVRQPVGKHEAGIEYDLERDVYYRELEIVVPGPNLWESAYYDEHEVELYWKHDLPHGIALKPSAGWRFRNFNSTFDYRDRDGLVLGLEASIRIGRDWRAFVSYEWSDLEADAGPTDPDTSYLQNEIEVGGAVELLEKKLDLSLKWRVAFRDFTTTNTPANDPSHADREDVRQRITFEARWKVGKGWALSARWEFRDVDSDQPWDTDPADPDGGDSTRNVYLLGVSVSL